MRAKVRVDRFPRPGTNDDPSGKVPMSVSMRLNIDSAGGHGIARGGVRRRGHLRCLARARGAVVRARELGKRRRARTTGRW